MATRWQLSSILHYATRYFYNLLLLLTCTPIMYIISTSPNRFITCKPTIWNSAGNTENFSMKLCSPSSPCELDWVVILLLWRGGWVTDSLVYITPTTTTTTVPDISHATPNGWPGAPVKCCQIIYALVGRPWDSEWLLSNYYKS